MTSPTPLPHDPRFLPAVLTERERDHVLRQLGEHFAQDHLSLEEYEFRAQAVLRATQWYELTATMSDLPTLDAVRSPRVIAVEGAGSRWKTLVAVMGGMVRKGSWRVPARLRVLAVMGGVELDLRDAELSAPVTEIYVLAVMGGVQIRVPPGVRLEAEGLAIMGGFEDQAGLAAVAGDASPVIRVRGIALMGGVVTQMKPRGWEGDDE